MDPEQYYRRISELLDTRLLRSKRVAVVGLGSGGCRVATELGRLGIELLLLERPGELLEEHNIVRHVLGYGSLGKPKLTEVSAYIRNLNPSVNLECFAMDVVEERQGLAQWIDRWHPDLMAVCTDSEASKHAINEAALRCGIPQVGAGVYDGGIGGEVYRVRPGEACYGCIAAQLQLQARPLQPAAPADYNSLDDGEIATTCALNLDIEQIAILQCRLILDLLLQGDRALIGLPPEVNVWVFANRVVKETFARPFHCRFFSITRKADCLECGSAPADLETEAVRILSALKASPTDP